MRTAWKPLLFVLASFILENLIFTILFVPDFYSTHEYSEFTITQGVYHAIWLSVTFILLHRLFKLTKWTAGCSIYVVLLSTGGMVVMYLDKLEASIGVTAIFAISWLIMTGVIAFKTDMKRNR